MSLSTLINELTGHCRWGVKHILIALVLSPVIIVVGLLAWGLVSAIELVSSHVDGL